MSLQSWQYKFGVDGRTTIVYSVRDAYGATWYKAREVTRVLGYLNNTRAVRTHVPRGNWAYWTTLILRVHAKDAELYSWQARTLFISELGIRALERDSKIEKPPLRPRDRLRPLDGADVSLERAERADVTSFGAAVAFGGSGPMPAISLAREPVVLITRLPVASVAAATACCSDPVAELPGTDAVVPDTDAAAEEDPESDAAAEEDPHTDAAAEEDPDTDAAAEEHPNTDSTAEEDAATDATATRCSLTDHGAEDLAFFGAGCGSEKRDAGTSSLSSSRGTNESELRAKLARRKSYYRKKLARYEQKISDLRRMVTDLQCRVELTPRLHNMERAIDFLLERLVREESQVRRKLPVRCSNRPNRWQRRRNSHNMY